MTFWLVWDDIFMEVSQFFKSEQKLWTDDLWK